ncbi:C4-dicarboxylate ABC transporter substrate-binding protein [Brevibacterium salitolerans]
MSLKRHWWGAAAMGAACSLLAGCAGSAGSGGAGGGDAGEGVAPGATAEEYAAALEDMDPVTLTLQSTASSAEDVAAYRSAGLKESVEELSGGKITIDIAYGPTIAPYTEVDAALGDGRIDLAYMIPIYQPDDYPAFSALAAGTGLAGTSPLVEELTVNAAMLEVAYGTDGLFDQYEERGVTPLIPFNATSSVVSMCTEPKETLDDWNGSVVSIGSRSSLEQTEALGAMGTSLEYTETFEALQRNTVNCALTTTLAATMTGLAEVAPHLAYSTEAGFGRGAGAFVGGAGYRQLPLAAQQLIYDQMGDAFKNSRRADLEGTSRLMAALEEAGGSIREMDAEAGAVLLEATEGIVADEVEAGAVDAEATARIEAALEKWRGKVEQLGYADEGDFVSFPEWHDGDPEALQPYADAVFDELMLEHRPS